MCVCVWGGWVVRVGGCVCVCVCVCEGVGGEGVGGEDRMSQVAANFQLMLINAHVYTSV